jgi:alpha-L-fucosidase
MEKQMSASNLEPIQAGSFEPTWESLRNYEVPQWFRNAKFGIWAHWGPQCVPMVGDWYARRIYQPNDPAYHFHWREYGHPSKVGYKDIAKLWKAENFDPEVLMYKYKAAGAKYFVAQAVHHDNFDNWNSAHNRWNAVNMGPHRDIVGEWKAAADKQGLPFGLSEHLGASFSWMRYSKGSDPDGPYAGIPYDGNDPAYEDFYHPNKDDKDDWYTTNPWWHSRWYARIKDALDKYHPDLLYSDGGVPFGEVGLSIIAHLYNTSEKHHNGRNMAVYNQKDTNPDVYRVGVLDIERGQRSDIAEHPWQTDTCVGGWFYDNRIVYKTPGHVIEMLIDIVSKNGNLLLNLPQRPDGTLDEQCQWILKVLTDWFKVNGEGIYDTTPWIMAGEGNSRQEHGAFKEDRAKWTPEDFRFTCKGSTVYAFQMKRAEDYKANISSLGLQSGKKVAGVRLLGYEGSLTYEQKEGALVVQMPDKSVAPEVPCLAVDIA